jgi:hypothetical protein
MKKGTTTIVLFALLYLFTGGISLVHAQTETYEAVLSGTNEVPPNSSTGSGTITVTLNTLTDGITVSGSFSGLTANYTNSHIHGPAAAGVNAGVIQGINDALTLNPDMRSGTYDGVTSWILSPTDVGHLQAGNTYVNIHTVEFGGGELRGQLTEVILPVELALFDALADGEGVTLRWQTASETNNAGFEVQHRQTGSFQRIDFIEGAGTTVDSQHYHYSVRTLAPGQHIFRLKQIDFDGTFHYSPEVAVSVEIPGAFHLSEAYPNPFNPTTTFTLTVAQQQRVRVEAFDALGRRVALLYQGVLQAQQTETIRFGASGLTGGVYLIRATGEAFSTTRRVTLLK